MSYILCCHFRVVEPVSTQSRGPIDHKKLIVWERNIWNYMHIIWIWSLYSNQMKFYLSCKKLDGQARLGRHKTVYSKVMLQAIEANPASSTWRVSGELGILQSRVVSEPLKLYLMFPKYCKTFHLLKYYRKNHVYVPPKHCRIFHSS